MAPSDVWPLRRGGQNTGHLSLCAVLTSPSPLGELSRVSGLLTWHLGVPQLGQHQLPGLLGPLNLRAEAPVHSMVSTPRQEQAKSSAEAEPCSCPPTQGTIQ